MEVIKVIKTRRTKRKFLRKAVSEELLRELIECARFAPPGANLQPLKYAFLNDDKRVSDIFKFTKWSGYHPEDAPTEAERPEAFIVMMGDREIKANGAFETDAGAAGTIIQLAAEELGLSSCWLGAIERKNIHDYLKLPEHLDVLYLIGVGYSEQKAGAVLAEGDIKYYTDADGVLNVPKRSLDEILINI